MWYYAQIDENGICFSINMVVGEIEQSNLIQVNNFDESYLGRKYNNGIWE